MKKTILIAAMATGLAAGAASAQQGPGGPQVMGPANFSVLDTNGDGAVSLDEMKAAPEAMFKAADTNGDGTLSADELTAQIMTQLQARIEGRVAEMIKRLDANGDGQLGADEMQPPRQDPAARMFDRMDTNHDGSLSQAEYDAFTALMQQMRGEHMGRGMGRGHDHGGRMGGGRMGGGRMGGGWFGNGDGNGN